MRRKRLMKKRVMGRLMKTNENREKMEINGKEKKGVTFILQFKDCMIIFISQNVVKTIFTVIFSQCFVFCKKISSPNQFHYMFLLIPMYI
jgi:hypothetical protein